MAGLPYDLVSPERKLASGEAESIQLPGAEGDLSAMPNHSPLVTTLRPGVVTVREAGAATDYVVTGGFAEISPAGASVLAEEAVAKADATADWFAEKIKLAEEEHETATGEAKILAAQRINDFRFLQSHLGV